MNDFWKKLLTLVGDTGYGMLQHPGDMAGALSSGFLNASDAQQYRNQINSLLPEQQSPQGLLSTPTPAAQSDNGWIAAQQPYMPQQGANGILPGDRPMPDFYANVPAQYGGKLGRTGMIGNDPRTQLLAFASTPQGRQYGQQMMMQLLKPKERDPKDNFITVPGVGLIDISDPNNPKTAVGIPGEKPKAPKVPLTPEQKKSYGIPQNVAAEYDPNTGDVTTLYTPPQATGSSGPSVRPMTADEKKAYGIPDGVAATIDIKTGRPDVVFTPKDTTGKPTEDQLKNSQLYTRASQQLPIVLKNFDALSHFSSQFADSLNPSMASTEYQQADNALTDIVASYLYSVSGATANPGEVENLVKTVKPKVGEAKSSVEQKKQRIQQMVESIKTRAGSSSQGESSIRTYNPATGELE